MSVRCPRCHKAWPSNLKACPEDGASFRLDDAHGDPAEVFAEEFSTETGKTGSFSGHDYTTVDATSPEPAGDRLGGSTAIARPFSGTPTPLSAVGPISSGEITAQGAPLPESTAPSTAEASNLDPTGARKLDPGFVHLVPGTLVGEYEIEKLLGSGGMGAVYGAHHEKLRRRAAIKVISPTLSRDRDAVERFEQEAQALARLSHPNIVSVLGVGTLPGDERSFFVMEWLDGEPLQARIDRGRMPVDDVIDLSDQIARGLEAAHAAGIVHRDLKPDNIWLQRLQGESRPVVKILDLGLAKLAQHHRSEETAIGIMFGTPQFMSPEQCQSARDVGPATDVYALGCLMFQLSCGRLPFPYDNAAELIVAHQTEEVPRPKDLDPSIDPQLDALLFAMLAKDPARRPTLAAVRSTVADARSRLLSDAMRASAPRLSSSTITAPQVVAARPAPSRRRIVAPAAAALLLLSIAFAITLKVATRSDSADQSAAEAAVSRVDASLTSAPPPKPTDSPVVGVKQPIDASAAVQKPHGPSHDAPRIVAPAVPGFSREYVDAGVAVAANGDGASPGVEIDAASAPAVEIDAGQRDSASRTQPVSVPKAPEPQVHRPPPRSEPKKPKLDKNQTFDPFTKQPSR